MSDEPDSVRSGETYPDVAGHFDRIAAAKKYEPGCEIVKWGGADRAYEEMEPFLDVRQKLRVVDMGAGTGKIGERFKKANPDTHVIGIDLSSKMLETATAMGRINEAHVGDVTKMGIVEKGTADAVTSAGVLDFIEDPKAFVANSARALKPGGVLSITFEPIKTKFHGHKTIRHDEASMRALFKEHGFRIVREVRDPNIYTNTFVNKEQGGAPVENVILVGVLENTPENTL
ncbi:MAG TPA: class I SAM-dependent methyltransferase [Alphaproteobacteria bacterium]|nr:class I SAM-dependent methyltransferase [Alphaproteobacteria bacterium]